MVMRVLEAQSWIDQFEADCRLRGKTSDEIASYCFAMAAVLKSEEASWLLDLCVDAKRKIGCTHNDLAIALAHKGQSLNLLVV